MQVSSALPACLLIGDSVAHGTYGESPWNFTGSVQDLLKDTCPVSNIESVSSGSEASCFWSTSTDAATGLPVKWSVIHYNEGLHSLWPRVNTSAELQQYADTLANFTEMLKGTGAKLVCKCSRSLSVVFLLTKRMHRRDDDALYAGEVPQPEPTGADEPAGARRAFLFGVSGYDLFHRLLLTNKCLRRTM